MLFTKIVYKNVYKIFKDYLENKKPKKCIGSNDTILL